MNVTLEREIEGVAYGDGYIINNAHKVKLAKITNGDSIAASLDENYYSKCICSLSVVSVFV